MTWTLSVIDKLHIVIRMKHLMADRDRGHQKTRSNYFSNTKGPHKAFPAMALTMLLKSVVLFSILHGTYGAGTCCC